MARYIVQLRRGTESEWADYKSRKPNEATPRDGELILVYDNGIPRLKIGDGLTPYDALPYLSIDSFILPQPSSVTLKAANWTKVADNRWYQVVTVQNATITPNSKVDLQPSAEQLAIFYEKDLTFVTENDDGVISVFCIGQAPTNDYTIQTTIMEVSTNG